MLQRQTDDHQAMLILLSAHDYIESGSP